MALFSPLDDETQCLESVYRASAHNRFRMPWSNGVSPRHGGNFMQSISGVFPLGQ